MRNIKVMVAYQGTWVAPHPWSSAVGSSDWMAHGGIHGEFPEAWSSARVSLDSGRSGLGHGFESAS